MRKLKKAEVLVLASVLVAGVAQSYDEPNPVMFPTISVTGIFYPQTRYYWPTNISVSPSLPPYPSGTNTTNTQVRDGHALNCASQYGSGVYKGPKPGFKTYYSANYGYRTLMQPYQFASSTIHSPPDPQHPQEVGGGTWTNGSVPTTYIFKLSNATMSDLIRATAHEFAHQWGAVDGGSNPSKDANKIGQAALDAYLADGGAKCGGIMQ